MSAILKVTKILKDRFLNLSTFETVELAERLLEAVSDSDEETKS